MSRAKIMVVMGPGRSCTSGVARALHLAGWPMGPEDELLPAHDSNPWGHYEHRQLVELNDGFLRDAGGDWLTPHPVTPDRWNVRVAVDYLDSRGTGQWGMKDPRLSVTWPIWDDAFAARPELEPILVYPNREQTAVAGSLAARDGLTLDVATEWAALYRDATLAHLKGR